MSNTSRVDKELFEDAHYLGKPADTDDLLVKRRINILYGFEGFFDANASLVEIGCGNGNTILQIADKFKHSYGLEYAGVHEKDFNALKSSLKIENSDFLVWDIMNEGFKPKCNRLLSFEVIEHLPAEIGVKNYAESLESGALCAISVPNKWWIFETHGASLPLLPWNRVPFFSWLPRVIHEKWALARIYTKKRIKTLMEDSGFEVLEMHYVMAPMDVVKWRPLQSFLRKYIFNADTTKVPFKAVSIMVFCKRK
jgi:SAM-dependent methyltransferase